MAVYKNTLVVYFYTRTGPAIDYAYEILETGSEFVSILLWKSYLSFLMVCL